MGYCFDKAIPHSKFLKWDPEDRAKVIAYQIEQSMRCQLCGTGEWEWDENKFAYVAVEKFCPGCSAKAASESDRSLPGTSIKLVPNTPQLKAQAEVRRNKRAKKDMEDYAVEPPATGVARRG